MGIQKPSAELIENFIRANSAEERMERSAPMAQPPSATPLRPALPEPSPQPKPENFRPKHPRGYSKSQLEAVLQEQGTLERPHGVRRAGRPRVIARWFPEVAKTMANGNSLKEELRLNGITLDKSQRRAVYRSEEFKRLFREARGY